MPAWHHGIIMPLSGLRAAILLKGCRGFVFELVNRAFFALSVPSTFFLFLHPRLSPVSSSFDPAASPEFEDIPFCRRNFLTLTSCRVLDLISPFVTYFRPPLFCSNNTVHHHRIPSIIIYIISIWKQKKRRRLVLPTQMAIARVQLTKKQQQQLTKTF